MKNKSTLQSFHTKIIEEYLKRPTFSKNNSTWNSHGVPTYSMNSILKTMHNKPSRQSQLGSSKVPLLNCEHYLEKCMDQINVHVHHLKKILVTKSKPIH